MQEREAAGAVAAAVVGAMYVLGHNSSDLWGATRESFALKAAASDVTNGPATELPREARREVVDRHTGEAAVDLRDKDAFDGSAWTWSPGVLPVLGQLPAETAERVRRWIIGIAAQAAEASYDIGKTEEISDAERRASTRSAAC